jgi:hypothetical protein
MTGPRLTPRRLAALQQAAAHPKGGIIPGVSDLTISDVEALEQLGYAASIDDCGHVNTFPSADFTPSKHDCHPHFLRITPAGRAAVEGSQDGRSRP